MLKPLTYRPDIDGLRAIAVFLVVLFHLFPTYASGGFIGVDIFFVISGFLISSILFTALDQGSFSLVGFYRRRIRRIFPALLVVLLASTAMGWYVLYIHEFKYLGQHLLGSAGFVSNWVLLTESGYFDHAAMTKPLLHLWSLAIEEQFYLLWPLLLMVARRYHWCYWPIILVIGSGSLAVSVYWAAHYPNVAFYSPLSRAWELAIGSGLAYLQLYQPERLQRYPQLQSLGGCLLLLVGLMTIDRSSHWPGWWALLPTGGTFWLISAGPQAWVNRILSHKTLVWFGLISYPLYLWHWPLTAYAHIIVGPALERDLRLFILVLSIGLAGLTYHLVEQPIRHPQRQTLVLYLMLAMAFSAGGGLLMYTGAITPRHHASNLQPIAAAIDDWYYHQYHPGMKKVANAPEGVYSLPGETSDTTLFLGDSHLEQYIPRILSVAANHPTNSAIFATAPGCPPAPGIFRNNAMSGYCPAVKTYGAELAQQARIKKVVVSGCWNCYFTDLSTPTMIGTAESYVLDRGRRSDFRNPSALSQGLADLEAFLQKLGHNKTLYLILDTPQNPQLDPRNFFTGNRLGRVQLRADHAQPVRRTPAQIQLSDKLRAIATRNHFQILDPMDILCPDNLCRTVDLEGRPIYLDKQHLRPCFVRSQAGFIDRTLRRDQG
jgi:peptidoglycan/LPS O-acetylase OafA/YrhL